MSSQLKRQRKRFRKDTCRHLRKIGSALVSLQSPYFNNGDNDIHISLLELDLHPESSVDIHPRFFDPYPQSDFDAVWPEYSHLGYWPGLDLEWFNERNSGRAFQDNLVDTLGTNYYDGYLASLTRWAKIVETTRQLTMLGQHDLGEVDNWDMPHIWQVSPKDKPHLMGSIHEMTPANEQIRRSELICAVHLIMQGMGLDRRNEFRIVPVTIYSFCGFQGRILQVHLDPISWELIVRKSPDMNLTDGSTWIDYKKLFLRWMMNRPIGNVRFPKLDLEPDIVEEDTTHGDAPLVSSDIVCSA